MRRTSTVRCECLCRGCRQKAWNSFTSVSAVRTGVGKCSAHCCSVKGDNGAGGWMGSWTSSAKEPQMWSRRGANPGSPERRLLAGRLAGQVDVRNR